MVLMDTKGEVIEKGRISIQEIFEKIKYAKSLKEIRDFLDLAGDLI